MSTESLGHYIDDIYSGLKTRLFYAPASFFSQLKLPITGSFEELMVVKEDDLILKEEMKWSYIDCLIDENDIVTNITGAVGRKKQSCLLNVYLLGLKSKTLGFIETHMNTPMIFLIPDANGNQWLIGNLRNCARLENSDGSSGKLFADNSGFSVSISAKTPLYRFGGIITAIEPSNCSPFISSGGFIDLTLEED